jgi:uncharacterized protein (DUF2062 family)
MEMCLHIRRVETMSQTEKLLDTSAIWAEGVAIGLAYSIVPLFAMGVALALGLTILKAPMKAAGVI